MVPATTALSRTEMHQHVVVWVIWASVAMLQYNVNEIGMYAQGRDTPAYACSLNIMLFEATS